MGGGGRVGRLYGAYRPQWEDCGGQGQGEGQDESFHRVPFDRGQDKAQAIQLLTVTRIRRF